MTLQNEVESGSVEDSIDGEKGRRKLVSLVIPMLNEREGLEILFSRVQDALAPVQVDWEIVIVDDGSTDGTRDVMESKLSCFSKWKFVILSRNFGQQPAFRAGLDATTGDAVIFLDADLQDPPELIGELVEKWMAGSKVVTATRTSRAEKGLRRLMFDLFHRLFYRLTDRTMPMNSGTFCLIDRIVVERLKAARETNLFLPALKCWYGFPQSTVDYARKNRAVGEPKQSFSKLFNYAFNGIISFSDKPLQWIGVTGFVVSLVSFTYGGILIAIKVAQLFGVLEGLRVEGFTTLAAGIFCLGGVQLLCLGIIGQYLARMYRELKQRPLYIIESTQSSHGS